MRYVYFKMNFISDDKHFCWQTNNLLRYGLPAAKRNCFSFDFSRVFLITQLRCDARPHPFLVAEKVSAGCAAGAYEHWQIGKSELGGCKTEKKEVVEVRE